jgi:hypothetical protein
MVQHVNVWMPQGNFAGICCFTTVNPGVASAPLFSNALQIGQMKQRPQQSDLELIFMNASAASSPLTGMVKSLKGIFSKEP